MMELIDEIRKITKNDNYYDDETIVLQEKDHIPKPINQNSFKTINNSSKNHKICFVDGGNAEILASPSFSLHLIRVYYCTYENKKRISSKRYEFWSLAKPIFDDKLIYEVNMIGYSPLGKKISFDPSDQTLKEGVYDANISKFGSIIRRFAELSAANSVAEGKLADIIVLDGSLQQSFVGEDAYLKNLIDNCHENNIKLAAISKTNNILTNKGRAATVMLNKLAPSGAWYCDIVHKKEDGAPKICFARLHPNSKHIFRIDYFDEGLFETLTDHSKDPIFLGYPYGLIEADSFARIPNREKQLLKTMLLAKLGKENDLVSLLSAGDAHQILDKMQY